jgi:hypothetical protein
MSIEFRCPTCTKLLRVGDDAAGKQAKCPQCGTILLVPATVPPAAPEPPQPQPTWPGPQGPTVPPPDADNPYRSPAAGTFGPDSPPQPGDIRVTPLSIESAFGATWTIFKERWGICLLAVIIVVVLSQIVPRLIGAFFGGIAAAAHSNEMAVMSGVLAGLIAMVFNMWLTTGQTVLLLKIARGQDASLGDIFSGGPYLLAMIGAAILVGLMVFLGLILLIVPGIILMLMFMPFIFVIVDRNAGVMESLDIARQITTGNKSTLFLIGLLTLVLFIPVVLTCFIGYLIWAPFCALLWAVAYLQMSGQPTADQFRSPGY